MLLINQNSRNTWCRKQIKILYNNQQIFGKYFLVWDGCSDCAIYPRLDFSLSGLQQMDTNACPDRIINGGTSYEITNTQIRQFVP